MDESPYGANLRCVNIEAFRWRAKESKGRGEETKKDKGQRRWFSHIEGGSRGQRAGGVCFERKFGSLARVE